MTTEEKKPVNQCPSCPWRVDCVPIRDIPNYVPDMHCNLDKTIQSGLETLFQTERHVMACHYSKPGEEFPCAGWLHNQIGAGNNLGVRLLVMTGKMSPPVVDGPQHETFEETLCNVPESETPGVSSTSSRTPTRGSRRSSRGANVRSSPTAAASRKKRQRA